MWGGLNICCAGHLRRHAFLSALLDKLDGFFRIVSEVGKSIILGAEVGVGGEWEDTRVPKRAGGLVGVVWGGLN